MWNQSLHTKKKPLKKKNVQKQRIRWRVTASVSSSHGWAACSCFRGSQSLVLQFTLAFSHLEAKVTLESLKEALDCHTDRVRDTLRRNLLVAARWKALSFSGHIPLSFNTSPVNSPLSLSPWSQGSVSLPSPWCCPRTRMQLCNAEEASGGFAPWGTCHFPLIFSFLSGSSFPDHVCCKAAF